MSTRNLHSPARALIWLEWHRQWKLWLITVLLMPLAMLLTHILVNRYLDPSWLGATFIYVLIPLLVATNAFQLSDPADRRQLELPISPLRLLMTRLGVTLAFTLPPHLLATVYTYFHPHLITEFDVKYVHYFFAGMLIILLLTTAVLLFTAFDLGAESALLSLCLTAVWLALLFWFYRQMTGQHVRTAAVVIAASVTLLVLLLGCYAWAIARRSRKVLASILALAAMPVILIGSSIAHLAFVYATQTPADYFFPINRGDMYLEPRMLLDQPTLELPCRQHQIVNRLEVNVEDGTWRWRHGFRLSDLKFDLEYLRLDPDESAPVPIGNGIGYRLDNGICIRLEDGIGYRLSPCEQLEFVDLETQSASVVTPPFNGAFWRPQFLVVPGKGLLFHQTSAAGLFLWWIEPHRQARPQYLTFADWHDACPLAISPDAQWLLVRHSDCLVNLQTEEYFPLPDFPVPEDYKSVIRLSGGAAPQVTVACKRGIAWWQHGDTEWTYMHWPHNCLDKLALSPDGQRAFCAFYNDWDSLEPSTEILLVFPGKSPGLQMLDLPSKTWNKMPDINVQSARWANNDYLAILTQDALVRFDRDGGNPYTLLSGEQ